MTVENPELIVVVTSIHGEKFVGWIPEGIEETPEDYMNETVSNGQPIELHNVRNYLCQVQTHVQGGMVSGLAKLQLLQPIDMLQGPMKVLHVMASSWFFPFTDKKVLRSVEELLENAEQNERINNAIAAGITPAGNLGGLPPPPGSH